MLWGGAILCSRVYLGYHTVPQVVIGAMLGGTSGAIWRGAWKNQMKKHGEKALQKAIDRTFRFVGC
jgi:membrane-associated phospholipid phosphatase